MITENVSTLKIHKLTQAQYDRELEAGTIDENALYLTPDEEIDLSGYATIEQVNGKADVNHNHGDVYYTEVEIDTKLSEKADASHNHDDMYYTESEIDSKVSTLNNAISGKAASSHSHAAGDIVSGTLTVTRGGTGVTANPSMLTNLGSTTAASVFAISPRPGVTGTLPILNGGTGATTAAAALANLGITYGTTDLTDGTSELATGAIYLVYEEA